MKITCLIRRSSPSTTSTSGSGSNATRTPSSVALAHHHHAALERLPKGERVHLELDLPCLDLGQIEHIVYQREQMVARGADVVEVLRLFVVHGTDHLVAQHLREADDRIQRRPELMGHVGQEL